MEYDLPIARMARGIDVEGFYLLKSAFSKVTATGKPFLTAVLADESGTIEAKVWDYTGPIGERDVGKAIKIRGSVSDYRGALQTSASSSSTGSKIRDLACISPRASTRPCWV